MKFVVLGAAGRMGSMHAKHLIEMGHTVYRVDPATGDDDYINDCDGVVIATPADCHLRDLDNAVEKQKHIFIEKPICLIGEAAVARKILEWADQRGLIVAVGYNLRFHPLVMQAKQMIGSGRFKPLWGSFLLRQKSQRPLPHFLEEWASHEIDLAMHLLDGGNIVKASSCKDNIKLTIDHANSVSFIHADATTPPPYRRAFTIVDQDGNSFTRDIELQHVQPEHYKNELASWIYQIEFGNTDPAGVGGPRHATGWEGLDVIRLLERIDD